MAVLDEKKPRTRPLLSLTFGQVSVLPRAQDVLLALILSSLEREQKEAMIDRLERLLSDPTVPAGDGIRDELEDYIALLRL
ncbi:MAG: hypothetical protein OXB91_12485 [Bryobacterales bacterium]|nr:hypothetical protein [Bryobacterales bacterium]